MSLFQCHTHYTLLLSKVIQNHVDISFQFYAVNTQLFLYLTHKNMAQTFDRLKNCLADVKKSANKLKLNPDKTKFILFGSKIQREKCNEVFQVNIFRLRGMMLLL